MGLRSEEHAGRTLLQPVMQEGRRLGPGPSLEDSRQYCQEELATLPEPCRHLNDPQSLTYQPSEALRSLQEETRQQTLARQTPRG